MAIIKIISYCCDCTSNKTFQILFKIGTGSLGCFALAVMIITHVAYYKDEISSCDSDESPWLRGMVFATLIIYWVAFGLICCGVIIGVACGFSSRSSSYK